jgi:hypothetical protein
MPSFDALAIGRKCSSVTHGRKCPKEAEVAVRRTIRLALAAVLAMTAVVVMAQNPAPLNFDDIVGVWNITYDDGTKGTFTMSKKGDGTPKVVVTSVFGESEVRDIVIAGDTITFHREVSDRVRGQPIRIGYAAKLVDGKLEGTGKATGLDGNLNETRPFTATRAE